MAPAALSLSASLVRHQRQNAQDPTTLCKVSRVMSINRSARPLTLMRRLRRRLGNCADSEVEHAVHLEQGATASR